MKKYDELSPQQRATFNFRIAEKVNTFLDDVSEVNKVLDVISTKKRRDSFKEEHVDLVFNLLERILTGLDYAPIVKDEAGISYRFKGFVAARPSKEVPEKGAPVGRYQSYLPASEEDIDRANHLRHRIERLERFTDAAVAVPEFRPREYFGDMAKSAEKEGLKPLVPDKITETQYTSRLEKWTAWVDDLKAKGLPGPWDEPGWTVEEAWMKDRSSKKTFPEGSKE